MDSEKKSKQEDSKTSKKTKKVKYEKNNSNLRISILGLGFSMILP